MSQEQAELDFLTNVATILRIEAEASHDTTIASGRVRMEEHGLKQTDLGPELGRQGIVSQLLTGKRELNKRQIDALSKRFNGSDCILFETATLQNRYREGSSVFFTKGRRIAAAISK